MTVKRQSYQTSEEATIAMVPDPDTWPNWPLLPLKNRKKDWGSMESSGYLVCTAFDGGYKPPYKVHGGLIFMISQGVGPVVSEYNSVEAMMQDGWVVD